jgi:hypothetical protein
MSSVFNKEDYVGLEGTKQKEFTIKIRCYVNDDDGDFTEQDVKEYAQSTMGKYCDLGVIEVLSVE